MKKKIILSLALTILISFMFTVQATEENGDPIPSPSPEPSVSPEPSPSPSPEIEDDFSDASEAKFEIEYYTRNLLQLKVSNIKVKDREHREYYVAITNSTSEPNESEMTYRTLKDGEDIWNVTEYAELKEDYYYWLLEKYEDDNNVEHKSFIIKGKKIEKPELPKYGDAFFATHITSNSTQIVFNGPNTQQRQFNIKIGRITDNNILNKLKNNTSDAYAKLTEYAESSPSIYNEKLTTVSDSQFFYDTSSGSNKIELNNLQDEEYYYMYIVFDDENGKFAPYSALTIAQANLPNNENWYLFFLGDDSFNWKDFDDENPSNGEDGKKDDNTIVPDKVIPQTGENTAIVMSVLAVICIGGALTYMAYRKNNYK